MIAAALGLLGAGVTELAAQGPPTRVFGKVLVDGQAPPVGTKVEAFIGGKLCGESVVRQIGGEIGTGYVVDVLAESSEAGCGADGRSITFKVGGRDVSQTANFIQGTFIELNLEISGAVATPPPGPTPAPFPAATSAPAPTPGPTPVAGASPAPVGTPPTPAASPAATPTPAATPVPGASLVPGATPVPGAVTSPAPDASPTPAPSGSPSASPDAVAGASPSPVPSATTLRSPGATPLVVSGTGTSGDADRGVPTALWVALGLALVAAAGGGAYWYQRRNRGATG